MAYNTYTTSDLVSDVQLLGHVPTGNNTFTASEILRLATLELQTPLMKKILATRGGYYMTYQDYDLASDGLYDIPSDCVGGALVNIELVQSTTIIPVNPIEESEQFSTISPTSISYGFFMRANKVQILPTPQVGSPRFWYIKRTSELIQTSAAGQITAINGAVITVSSLPSTIVTGVTVDACGDQPPFNILGTEEVTDVSGTDVTLENAVTGLAVGDWLALEGQTPIPQIPVEFRLILAQRIVCKIYELQGYLDKLAAAQKKLKEYEDDLTDLITPRVSTKSKVINPVNGGFLSGNQNKITNFPAARNV